MRMSSRARRKLVALAEKRLGDRVRVGYYPPLHIGNQFMHQRLRHLRLKYPGGVRGEVMARPLRSALECLMSNDDSLAKPFEYRERARKTRNYYAEAVAMARKGSAKEFRCSVEAPDKHEAHVAEHANLILRSPQAVDDVLAEMLRYSWYGNSRHEKHRIALEHGLILSRPDPMEED